MEDSDIKRGEVLEANEAFYAAFNQKDYDAMDAIWAVTDEVACIHPGWNVLQGRELVMESWRGILSNPAQPRIITAGAGVTFLGDAALVFCRELVGGSALIATNVFVQRAGLWKLLHHQSGPVSAVG